MADLFPGFLDAPAGSTLLALSLMAKAALILGGAWLLARIARRASAAVRHGIWAVAVVGVVLLPLATWVLPSLPVDFPGLGVPTAAVSGPDPAGAWGDQLVTQQPATARARNRAVQPRDPITSLSTNATARPESRIPWLPVLLLTWAVGTVLLLLRLLVQLARVRFLSGYAQPESDGPIVRQVERLARELGIRRPVCVLESSWVTMPLTWGVLRPVILLPEAACEWPTGRLRVVLLHELAHIRRWDYLTHLAGEIACTLYWPLPLVWLARQRVQAEQEQACDDLVLASGTASLEYAEHLLAVARAFYGNRWELGMTVTMAREISLKQRIRTILDDRTNRRPLWSVPGLIVLLLLAGFSVPVAALRPDSRGADRPEVSSRNGARGPDDDHAAPAAVERASLDDVPDRLATLFWLEAEEGTRRGPMDIREDLGASAGAYVVVPDAEGNDAPAGGSGEATYSFEIAHAGDYLVWGRVIGDQGNDNSLYVSIDGGREIRWDIEDDTGELVKGWDWIPVRDELAGSQPGAAMRFPLAPGVHTLRIRNREDGTRLDRLLISADPSYVPSGRGALAGRRPMFRWMEVEQARLTGAIEHGSDEANPSRQFISFQRGEGAEASGTASFVFDVEEPGRYVVWGRVLAPNDGANSLYVSLDGGAEVIWDTPQRDPGQRAGWWSWSPLSAREYNGRPVDPLLLDLAPGRHVLRLRTREAGTRLDGILVTNDAAFRPRGVWPAALPSSPTRISLEAESARLEAPLFIRGDHAAGGGLYVQVEESSPQWEEPSAATTGSAIMGFTVPQAGLYNVWARTLARHDGEDSFWVRVNGGRWIRWNAIPKGESWRWSMVHDADRQREVAQFQLRPGQNTIELAPREGGARLDRLLITNDPLFDPDAPSR